MGWVSGGPSQSPQIPQGGAGENRWLHLERVEPDFIQQGEMYLIITGRPYAQAEDKESDPFVFDPDTFYIDKTHPVLVSVLDKFWKCYSAYAKKYSILLKSNTQGINSIRIQKTDPGGGYHNWHYENDGRHFGSRLAAFIIYLNNVPVGGETEFLYYPRRIKPKAGTLVIWPAGFTHTHRGNPPISNTKYIITGWIEY